MPKLLHFSTLAALLLTAAAGAQSYPGENVSVDYSATGNKVLLYPGGKYGRVVHTLRQPGEFTGPVKLHKPGKRVAKPEAATPRPPAPAPIVRAEAQPPRPVAPPAKKPPTRRTASLPPPPPIRSAPQTPPASDYDDLVVAKPSAPPQRQTRPPRPATLPSTKPVLPPVKPKPPTRVASIPPPSEPTETAGNRRGSVGFEPNASDPSSSAVQNIGRLAEDLNDALLRGSTRVQLLAYAGPKGEKSSDSRRLSLKRALIVRQLLIDSGVPSDRIDVRAMGGATDSGAADRVDVFVKS